jgi:hypothetical protein
MKYAIARRIVVVMLLLNKKTNLAVFKGQHSHWECSGMKMNIGITLWVWCERRVCRVTLEAPTTPCRSSCPAMTGVNGIAWNSGVRVTRERSSAVVYYCPAKMNSSIRSEPDVDRSFLLSYIAVANIPCWIA